MRRRILLAILLAVAVTGAALGVPLGVTTWLLVENLTREDLASSAQRIAAILDDARMADLEAQAEKAFDRLTGTVALP